MKITNYIERCIQERVRAETSFADSEAYRVYGYKYLQSLGGRPMTTAENARFLDNRMSCMHDLRANGIPRYAATRSKQLREWVESLPEMPPEWAVEPPQPAAQQPPKPPL